MAKRSILLLALAAALGGCASGGPKGPPAAAPLELWQEGIIGYRLRDSSVVFEFEPGRFEKATRFPGGARVMFESLTIADVSVVGDFNDWTPGSWPMERVEPRRFVLEKNAASLGPGDRHAFGFVVNGSWWAETPKAAKNIAPGRPDGGVSLVLRLHSSSAP